MHNNSFPTFPEMFPNRLRKIFLSKVVITGPSTSIERPRNFEFDILEALSLDMRLLCLELKLWIFNTQQQRYNTEHQMALN